MIFASREALKSSSLICNEF